MKLMNQIQQLVAQNINNIDVALAKLSPRERYMVIVTGLLIVITVVGCTLWKIHTLADQQQKRASDLKELMAWMQSNAAVMKVGTASAVGLSEQVQQIAQQQGIALVLQPVGEQLQLTAEHQNYAVLANFITQLTSKGVSIKKLDMNSNNHQIKLTMLIQ